MTSQIKVDFSYLIGEFRSLTGQSFHRQVYIKTVNEGELIMIIVITMIVIIIIIIIIIIIVIIIIIINFVPFSGEEI